MKCYYNPAQDAVGVCKSCGKGLSVEHAADLGKGLACKGRCERDVRELIQLVDNNVATRSASMSIIRGTGASWMISSSLYLLLAGFLIFLGWETRPEPQPFMLVIGGLFLVYAMMIFYRGLSIQRAISRESAERKLPR